MKRVQMIPITTTTTIRKLFAETSLLMQFRYFDIDARNIEEIFVLYCTRIGGWPRSASA
jgi:hypothetical protein